MTRRDATRRITTPRITLAKKSTPLNQPPHAHQSPHCRLTQLARRRAASGPRRLPHALGGQRARADPARGALALAACRCVVRVLKCQHPNRTDADSKFHRSPIFTCACTPPRHDITTPPRTEALFAALSSGRVLSAAVSAVAGSESCGGLGVLGLLAGSLAGTITSEGGGGVLAAAIAGSAAGLLLPKFVAFAARHGTPATATSIVATGAAGALVGTLLLLFRITDATVWVSRGRSSATCHVHHH